MLAEKLMSCSTDITEEERSLCAYGERILRHTILSTAGLLLVGILLCQIKETCIMIFLFYINQTIGGGYHAKTGYGCFAVMTLGLLLGLSFTRIVHCGAMYLILGLFACIVLLTHPVAFHENKSYLWNQISKYVFRSRIITLGEMLALLYLCLINQSWIFPVYSTVLFLSAISRLTGVKVNNSR